MTILEVSATIVGAGYADPYVANRTLLIRMLVAQDAGSPDFRFKGVCGHAFLAAPPVTSVGAGRFRGVASPPALHNRTSS